MKGVIAGILASTGVMSWIKIGGKLHPTASHQALLPLSVDGCIADANTTSIATELMTTILPVDATTSLAYNLSSAVGSDGDHSR